MAEEVPPPDPNPPPAGGGCPPGWTSATTPGATPGSCVDGAGHVVSPDAFFLAQTVDSSYSPAQWQTWINLGGYNSSTHKFRPERTGPGGEILDAWVDKPTDCPPGMTAAGASKCFEEGDPRLYPGAAPPPTPAPVAEAPAPAEPGSLQAGLEDLLASQGGVFSQEKGRGAITNPGAVGSSLLGGGLWWSQPAGVGGTPVAAAPAEDLSKPLIAPRISAPKPPVSLLQQGLLKVPFALPATLSPLAANTSPLQQELLKRRYPFATSFSPNEQWWA